MSDSFLSQDEVDALLDGVDEDGGDLDVQIADGDAPPTAATSAAAHAADAAPAHYAPANLEAMGRPRLARLETIHDRFIGFFQTALLKFLGRKVEVVISSVRHSKYKDFTDQLVLPVSLNLVRIEPLAGNALFILEPDLIFLVVDNLFGGQSRLHASETSRDFTLTEQRITQRLLAEVLSCYTRAWEEVHPLRMSVKQTESHTKFIRLAADNDWIMTATLTVQLGNTSSQMHLCIPAAVLEPIRGLLSQQPEQASKPVDQRWLQRMSRQLQNADVELVAHLCEIDVTLGDLMKMQPGDFIPLEMPEGIQVYVDAVPVMQCHYGISNQQYALRVDRLLSAPGG